MSEETKKDKVVAGILSMFFNMWGGPFWYLGDKKSATYCILITVIGFLCVGLGPVVMGIIGLIRGLKMMICSDEAFQERYVNNMKLFTL